MRFEIYTQQLDTRMPDYEENNVPQPEQCYVTVSQAWQHGSALQRSKTWNNRYYTYRHPSLVAGHDQWRGSEGVASTAEVA